MSKQRALRPFEQNALALAAILVEQLPHAVHIGQHTRRDAGERVIERVQRDFLDAQAPPQRVVMGQRALQLGSQRLQVLQVHHADRAAPNLVLIGRADAALRRADGVDAGRRLAQAIQLAMERQDQRGVLGDAQILAREGDALAC